MSLISAVLNSNKGRIVLGVIIAWAGFQLWLTLAAHGKISSSSAAVRRRSTSRSKLPFVPERFHVARVSTIWRVTGTDDHSIELRGVKRTDLNAVARPYWVTAVGPIKQGG